MRSIRASFVLPLVMGIGGWLFMAAMAAGQGSRTPAGERPNLKPGDRLEVMDGAALKEAEFVEFTPVGLIGSGWRTTARSRFVRISCGCRKV